MVGALLNLGANFGIRENMEKQDSTDREFPERQKQRRRKKLQGERRVS
jgi:hypothetical protein